MFDTTDFTKGFWIMLGVVAALVLVSILMRVFGKVAGG